MSDQHPESPDLRAFGLRLEPTIAMVRGEQQVFQCADCGTVVVRSSLATAKRLGPCPGCAATTWWSQTLPLAGLRPFEPFDEDAFAEAAAWTMYLDDNTRRGFTETDLRAVAAGSPGVLTPYHQWARAILPHVRTALDAARAQGASDHAADQNAVLTSLARWLEHLRMDTPADQETTDRYVTLLRRLTTTDRDTPERNHA